MVDAAHGGAIAMASGATALGFLAVFTGVMTGGTSFLIFGTMAIQLAPGAIGMTQQVNEELQRRQGICDQVQAVRDRIAKYNELENDLDKLDVTEITTKLTDLNDDVDAANKKMVYVQQQFYKNLSITVLIYVAIIAILGYIIISKNHTRPPMIQARQLYMNTTLRNYRTT